jgi:hypothetical protein
VAASTWRRSEPATGLEWGTSRPATVLLLLIAAHDEGLSQPSPGGRHVATHRLFDSVGIARCEGAEYVVVFLESAPGILFTVQTPFHPHA